MIRRPQDHTLTRLAGCLLVLIGILCNEWLLTHLLSSDGVIEARNRVFIWLFDVWTAGIGISLLCGRLLGTMISRTLRSLNVVILSVVTTYVSLKWLPAPYVWISSSWCMACLYGMCLTRRPALKAVWFNASLVCLVLGLFEGYLWTSDMEPYVRRVYRTGKQYVMSDAALGYAPRKNSVVSVAKYFRQELLYEVTYTIDGNGLRIAPPDNGNEAGGCVLFFGGSFTFGEGVNDHETMPYQTGIKAGGRFRIYNFGFHGYGPHQMLASLESGFVESIVDCEPRYAIYQGMLGHIARSAGLEFWDTHGPKYVLKEDGKIALSGRFGEDGSGIGAFGLSILRRSLIARRIFAPRYDRNDSQHMRLYVGIIERSRDIFEAEFGKGEFHMLFWDEREYADYDEVFRGMKSRGIRIHLMSDVLEDIAEVCANREEWRRGMHGSCLENGKYAISKYDVHPNALAYEKMADYIVHNVLAD